MREYPWSLRELIDLYYETGSIIVAKHNTDTLTIGNANNQGGSCPMVVSTWDILDGHGSRGIAPNDVTLHSWTLVSPRPGHAASVSETPVERPPKPSENATDPTQHQGPSKDGGE